MAEYWDREMKLHSRTVGVVTGAGGALGAACARQLVDHVDMLVVTDRDPQAAVAVARELVEDAGVNAEPFTLDVGDYEGLRRLGARIEELGALRAVVHADVCSPTHDDWRRILTADLVATARLADVLRPLADNGTAMVVIAAISPMLDPEVPDPAALAVLDDPLNPHFLDRLHEVLGPAIEVPAAGAYTWSKRGVQRFVRRESVRLGSVGARICSVSPGVIESPLSQLEAAEYPSVDRIVQRTPLRRKGHAEEVAAVVAFALSEQASFLNGIDLLVDGGACAASDISVVGDPGAARPVLAS